MKVKSEKTKLIIWALVALVVGVVIGMIITNVTTGNAKSTLALKNSANINPIKLTWDCQCVDANVSSPCEHTSVSVSTDYIDNWCKTCCVANSYTAAIIFN